MLVLAFFIDALLTVLVSFGAAWFFTSRYLVKRSQDRLGLGDLGLLRRAVQILVILDTINDRSPFGWGDDTGKEIKAIIKQYNTTKETF